MSSVCFAALRAAALTLLILLAGAAGARAEDGYELWLRYHRVADTARLQQSRAAIGEFVASIWLILPAVSGVEGPAVDGRIVNEVE